MKTFFEYIIVSVIAVAMGLVGLWLMEKYGGDLSPQFLEFKDLGFTVLLSLASILTWVYLYRMCHPLHWLVMPVMGIFSPFIGACLLMVPYFFLPLVVLWEYAAVIFPVGLVTGLVISAATLPLRPRQVRFGNV